MVVPRRHELTDEEWALLAPLLPPQRGAGRPFHDHRRGFGTKVHLVTDGRGLPLAST